MKAEKNQPSFMHYPPVPVATTLAVLVALIEVFLDWMTQVHINVAIIYGLPLVLVAAGRSRRLLWGLALFLILMTFSVYAVQISPGVFSSREPLFVNRVLAAAALLLTAGLLHIGMIAADTTEAQSRTLKDQNEQMEAANRELLRREHQQAQVAELGRRALIGIDLDQVMNEAVSLVRSQLAVESCNVLELLPDGRVLFQAGVGWGEGLVGQAATEAQSAIPAAQVLRTQAPVIVEDLGTDGRFPDAVLLRQHGVISSLNVPLYGHERPFGVLGAHTTRRRRFTDEDIHFVQSVANVLSAAIERKWLEQRQHEQHLHRAEQMMAIGQVAAGVAHELRNPLTSIKGLIQVNLREARAHGLPEEDLAVIEHEIRRMERSLHTFLDFARPPKPERRRLDPATVVERVFALVAGRAKKQGVSLRLAQPGTPVWLEGDQDQLQQLLLNLILNSLDAMPQGGLVEVELRPPRDGLVELQVRDTGPGIPAHILPKVFETFVSSKETGVGLGVPVSKRIAEDHGGSLSAYNLPEGGACFVLRLPVPDPS